MDIGVFQEALVYVDVPFGDETARIGYSVRTMTAVGMVRVKALTGMESEDSAEIEKATAALDATLAEFIGQWDLTWHGEPLAPTLEAMQRLAFPIKLKLLLAIAEGLQPPKSPSGSPNGSTAAAVMEPVLNGTG